MERCPRGRGHRKPRRPRRPEGRRGRGGHPPVPSKGQTVGNGEKGDHPAEPHAGVLVAWAHAEEWSSRNDPAAGRFDEWLLFNDFVVLNE